MNIMSLSNYFEVLCSKHVNIAHTTSSPKYFSDIDEAEAKLRSGLAGFNFIMGPPMFDIDMTSQDAIFDNNSISFLIVRYVKNDDILDRLQAYDECKQIAYDFISKMRYDKLNCTGEFDYVDLENAHTEPLGPILDGYYGTVTDISFLDDVDLELNDSRWDENGLDIVDSSGEHLTLTRTSIVVEKAFVINLPGGDDPYKHNTGSVNEPYSIELTDSDGNILDIPQQCDVKKYFNNATGYWELHIISDLMSNVKLSYMYNR